MSEAVRIMLSMLAVLSHVTAARMAPSTTPMDELIVGGLFPVHEMGIGNSPCGRMSEGRGIHRVEAMLFALDKINSRTNFLRGIHLRPRILDTCANPSHALNLSLSFVREQMGAEISHYTCKDGSNPVTSMSKQHVVGIIGGSYSGVSVQTAHLLRLFEIVQISPASTTADLSDKTRFEYFARTVPSDHDQARAIVDVARRYNWTYVSLVYSSGEYGEPLAEYFKVQARNKNICVALEEKLPRYGPIRDQIRRLYKAVQHEDRGPRVVVMFTSTVDTRNVLQQAAIITGQTTGTNASNEHTWKNLQWLAADGWETRPLTTLGWERIAQNALIITLEAQPVPEFNNYFLSLSPFNPVTIRNEWFHEFWQLKFNCSLHGITGKKNVKNQPACSPDQRIAKSEFQPDDKVQFVVDAVFAMAHALNKAREDLCKEEPGACAALKSMTGKQFYQEYLLNVSFKSVADSSSDFQFNREGDGPANYRFMYYHFNVLKRKYEYIDVGRWKSDKLTMEDDKIWTTSESGKAPVSVCSPICPVGQRKELMQKGEACCWACIPCADNQYMTNEFTCVDCPQGQWPQADRKTCYFLPVEYMQWESAYSIAACSLASVGIFLALQVIAVYAKYWNTPVIKASGRELSCVLLVGVLLCYCMTFAVLAKPGRIICGIRRVGVGLGFAVLYSAMLVKTNRIYRIFTNAQRAKRCRFISPMSQLVISGILISGQVLASLIWLGIEAPAETVDYPSLSQAVSRCAQDDHWFLVALSYDAILIIICTVYAVKTRTVPENFNEAKFIGFTMYTTCVIWLAFVPLYFGTQGNFKIQLTTLSICVTLSATVALLCLYAPKVWIVLFEPEKNIRRHGPVNNGGTQWATLLIQAPNMYTPLLSLRPLPGTQNVYLAPPPGFRARSMSANHPMIHIENGPNAISPIDQNISDATESYE